jgi:lambda repressor-like predicted transcriptional regulator
MGLAVLTAETTEAVLRLCREQGRTKEWIARSAGLTPSMLSHRLAGRYRWRESEARLLAHAFGVPESVLWPESSSAGEVSA